MFENSGVHVIGNGWSQWALVSTLESCALLIIVSLIWFVIRKRSSPQFGLWLFLLVPLKLLFPFSLPAPAEVANVAPANSVENLFTWDSVPSAETVPLNVSADLRQTTLKPADSSASNFKRVNPQPDNPPVSLPMEASVPDGEASSVSIELVAFSVWLTVAAILLLRFVYSQIVLSRQLRSATHVKLKTLPIRFDSTAKLAGLKTSSTPKFGQVQLLESSYVSSPIVAGLLYPKIVLPEHFSESSSAEHLQWAVLHELAHIKRFDLWFSLVQRVVALVCWFNPAVWIANHFVDRFREFACDDFASLKCDSKSVQAGEAFLEVVKFASSDDYAPLNALGFFGWNESATTAKSETKIRLGRILDESRCMCLSMGWLPVICIAILAFVTVPKLQAADDGEGDGDQQPVAAGVERIEDTGVLELLVVDSQGEPIPKASIEIRTEWKFGAEQVKAGTYVKKKKYGTGLLADENGVLRLAIAETPKRFELFIRTEGYGPYYSPWNEKNASLGIPAKQKVTLDSAWTVGGVVVDLNGDPVVDAKVHPSLKFKTRPGIEGGMHSGTSVNTDANGHWEYSHVPVHLSEISVEIKQGQHKPFRASLSRNEYELRDGKPRGKLSLEEGLTVTGTVTDSDGNPVEGALVRTKFLNHKREAKTGSDGVYKLGGCEPRNVRVVVSAPGKALELREVPVSKDMEPVDFELGPGNLIRMKVVDPEGKPLPNAGFFLQRWRTNFRVGYFEFDHVKCKTNEGGIWEWNEAPNDAFVGDIYYRGKRGEYMSLSEETIEITDEIQLFKLNPQLYVSGKVTDAKTGEPVKTFKVIPGVEAQQRNTTNDEGIDAENGSYRIKHYRQSYPVHFVRIEAEGYQPVESRDISPDEGEVTIDFKLERAANIASRVLTPDGEPAGDATVVVGVAGSQISIDNGRLNKSSTYQSPNVVTDPNGEFQFPPREKGFQLVVLHDSGFAHLVTGPLGARDPSSNMRVVDSLPKEIELTPWAQVSGIAKTGEEPLAGKEISLMGNGLSSYGGDVPNIFASNKTVAGKNGEFRFERVFPGRCNVMRSITLVVNQGAMEVASSRREIFNLDPGQSKKVYVGGTGRAVVGSLVPAKGMEEKPRWEFAKISVVRHVDAPPIPKNIAADPVKRKIWYDKWLRSPLGIESTRLNAIARNSPNFFATVDDKGNFRIDDMPSGQYKMRVRFDEHSAGSLNAYLFKVDDDSLEAPIELGKIRLKP